MTTDRTQYNLQILLPGAEPLAGPSITCPLNIENVAQLGEQLAASGFSPADLRSRSIIILGDDAALSCVAYAALIGFSGRYLDVSDGTRVVDAGQIAAAAKKWGDGGRLPVPVAEAQIGATHPTLPSVGVGAALTPAEVSVVSYARKLRFVPPSSPLVAVTQLVAIAAIRQRGLDERLPHLAEGSESETTEVPVRLDDARRIGQDLRRSLDLPERSATVEAVPLTARQERLVTASKVDLADTMRRLGGRENEETGLWHCPRPERHTNGDANASMKLTEAGVRCFRCDFERVDPLRLTIDTLGCSVDEAADWLLSGAARPQLATA